MSVSSPSSAAPLLIVTATLAILSGSILSGCRCACGEESLVQVIAQVPRTELSRGGGGWTAAAIDDGLEIGDALRTGESGQATLTVRGQGTVRVGPGSLVRFGEIGAEEGGEEGLRLTLETGELEVDASDTDAPTLVLGGPGGQRIHLEPGTRLRMQFDDAERLRLDITEGATRIEGEGEATELEAGESFLFGDAERLETEPDTPSEPVDAGVASDAATDAGDADQEPASGVTARNLGRAEVEVRGPEAEEFTRARRARLTLEPGTAVQVTGGEGLELRGPEGATVTLQPGSRAVIRGIRGDRLMVGLGGGRARAASSGAGVADLTVPGGTVETENTGAAPAFLATVRDRRSTRVNVTSGAAVVTSDGRRERVLTGAEVIVGAGRLNISRTRDLPPVMSSSGILFDPQRQGAFTIRFQPIPECELYVIEVDRNGRRHTEALTERPSLALSNVEYGEYRWRAGCLVDGEPTFADAREGRISRYPRPLGPCGAADQGSEEHSRHRRTHLHRDLSEPASSADAAVVASPRGAQLHHRGDRRPHRAAGTPKTDQAAGGELPLGLLQRRALFLVLPRRGRRAQHLTHHLGQHLLRQRGAHGPDPRAPGGSLGLGHGAGPRGGDRGLSGPGQRRRARSHRRLPLRSAGARRRQ